MAYRNITVNGLDYQYTIGSSHVKVRGFQAIPLEAVGKVRSYPEYCCEFRCEQTGHYQRLSVQPSDVAEWIQREMGVC